MVLVWILLGPNTAVLGIYEAAEVKPRFIAVETIVEQADIMSQAR